MEAGRAFQRALADLPRPGFLDRRTDPRWIGDQVAWQERPPDSIAPWLRGSYEVLEQCLGPSPPDRPQLVHGDLTGNVLFAPGLAPAVIDFSPYWRPAVFGEAVVVGDAVIWHGAGDALLSEVAAARGPVFLRYVARAVVYRLVTSSEFARTERYAETPEAMSEARRPVRPGSPTRRRPPDAGHLTSARLSGWQNRLCALHPSVPGCPSCWE